MIKIISHRHYLKLGWFIFIMDHYQYRFERANDFYNKSSY